MVYPCKKNLLLGVKIQHAYNFLLLLQGMIFFKVHVSNIEDTGLWQVTGSQLTAEQLKERREQQIRRLKESNAKRRLEKARTCSKNYFAIIEKSNLTVHVHCLSL